MSAYRNRSRHSVRADVVEFAPPNLRTLNVPPFTIQERHALGAWLAEDGWPRGRMGLATLEGYLVALLVWPVGIAPGAWLPPIWGDNGWKVPAKIASPELYAKFIERVVGFLQHLDRVLSSDPLGFAPVLTRRDFALRGREPPGISWAQGFLKALQQGSKGLHGRPEAVRAAVERIAHYASCPAHTRGTDSVVTADLKTAVLTLAAARPSRGPLGALEARDSGRLRPPTGMPASLKEPMPELDRPS
jgi:yecA family protein